jgi:murein L,D-transpeptidase YafK
MRILFFILLFMLSENPFKKNQLQNSRVKDAYAEKENAVKNLFKEKGIDYSSFNIFLRAFKKEMKLEVWVKDKTKPSYTLLTTYPICSSSGTLGPKRKEGDLQIPEGVYEINHFNPLSNFHLSLGINYPNAADKVFADAKHPGSAIYLHGNCVTIGCIPITDDKIKELYILTIEAKNNGQDKIPVHIFPTKLDDNGMDMLKSIGNEKTLPFWQNLKVIYSDFETTQKLRKIIITKDGKYTFERESS